ncbi:Secreted RxLR effector peptide protein [Phytophthora palmivora]|uniref:Secreted RxLR effector peptide protein n=1 Tax=Phytophthora palmivora TaxID=4796 RepID=A0A2P4YTK7_9STRA|nr:Secreted RxLR effector peptide protein [Phytophthora palmivora]
MRILDVVLLGVAIFTTVDGSVSTTNPNSVNTAPHVGAGNRQLRVSATTDTSDEERLAIPKFSSTFTSWFSGNTASKIAPTISSKFATTDDELLKMLNKGVLPDDVFRGVLKLDRVDDLFTNAKLNTWVNYLDDFNAKYPKEKTSMVQTFTQNFGDDQLSKMIAAAMKNTKTKAMAENLQAAQLKQWLTDKKTPQQVFNSLGLQGQKNLAAAVNGDVWSKYNRMYNAAKKSGVL